MMLTTACSEDKAENIYITNPAMQDIMVKAGDTGAINFKATGTWKISSDTPEWLSLGSSTGGAGDQKVPYTVSDTGLAFDKEDIAKVTLTTDIDSFTCTITRAAKERTMAFVDDEQNSQSAVVIAFDETASELSNSYKGKVSIEANFDWKIASHPEWATPNISEGVADALGTVWFTLDIAKLSTTGFDGEVVFTDASGQKFSQSIAIKFYGAEPSSITFQGSPMMKFTADQFAYTNIWDEQPSELKEVSFDIASIENGYKMIFITKAQRGNGLGQMELGTWAAWVEIAAAPASRAIFTSQSYTLTVKDNTTSDNGAPAERSATMYLVPATVYAKMTSVEPYGDPGEYTMLIEDEGGVPILNPDFAVYEAAQITQMAPAGGFKFACNDASGAKIENYGDQGEGYEMYSCTIPATPNGTATINVTLPENHAGKFPDGVSETTFTITLADYSASEPTNLVEVPTIINSISDDGLSYNLVMTVPVNTGKSRTGAIQYKDQDGKTIGVLNFFQEGPVTN